MITFWSKWARTRCVVGIKRQATAYQRGMYIHNFNFTQLEARVVAFYGLK